VWCGCVRVVGLCGVVGIGRKEWHIRGFEGLVNSIIGGGEGIGVGAGCKQSRESGILLGFVLFVDVYVLMVRLSMCSVRSIGRSRV